MDPKRLWEFSEACKACGAFFGFLFLAAFLIIIFIIFQAGGLPMGLIYSIGALLATLGYRRTKFKKKFPTYFPMDLKLLGLGKLYNHLRHHEKLYGYIQKVKSEINVWIVYLLFSLPLLACGVLFPELRITGALALIVMVGGFVAPLVLILFLNITLEMYKARDPRRISEFFNISEKKWRIELQPYKRPFSIACVSLLHCIAATIFFILGWSMIIAALTGTHLFILDVFRIPAEWGRSTVMGAMGATFVGFSIVGYMTARRFWIMSKVGAIFGVFLSSLVLFIGVFTYLIAPLLFGYVGASIYHAIWIVGIPILIIYFARKHWRKFR